MHFYGNHLGGNNSHYILFPANFNGMISYTTGKQDSRVHIHLSITATHAHVCVCLCLCVHVHMHLCAYELCVAVCLLK